jgi:hypothetical protein
MVSSMARCFAAGQQAWTGRYNNLTVSGDAVLPF